VITTPGAEDSWRDLGDPDSSITSKTHGYKTEVGWGQFRNTRGNCSTLAGCDLLTISPKTALTVAAKQQGELKLRLNSFRSRPTEPRFHAQGLRFRAAHGPRTAWPTKNSDEGIRRLQQAIEKPSKPSWPIASVSWRVKRPSPMRPGIFLSQRFRWDGCITARIGAGSVRSSIALGTDHERPSCSWKTLRGGLGAPFGGFPPLPAAKGLFCRCLPRLVC